jgi:hypothetical protein
MCRVLQTLMDKKNVKYELIENEDEVRKVAEENNIMTIPFGIVDSKLMNSMELREYINKL